MQKKKGYNMLIFLNQDELPWVKPYFDLKG